MKKVRNSFPVMWQERFLQLLVVSSVVVWLVDISGEYARSGPANHGVFDWLKIAIPLLLLIIHSTFTLTIQRGLLIMVVFFLCGLIAEWIGINMAFLFGGQYLYDAAGRLVFSDLCLLGSLWAFGSVPIIIPLYWAVFLYAGYSVTNSFFLVCSREKPCHKTGTVRRLFVFMVVDALILVAMDLILDPILVTLGNWRWATAGAYYGIPVGNFIGWLCVAFVSSGIFRGFEYCHPQKLKNQSVFMLLVPSLCLALFFLVGVFAGRRIGLEAVARMGILGVTMIVSVNLALWARRKHVFDVLPRYRFWRAGAAVPVIYSEPTSISSPSNPSNS